MKVARVNAQRLVPMVNAGGLGGAAPPGSPFPLDDLTDVDTTGVMDGDTLIYDAGSSTWLVGPPGSPGIWVPVMTLDAGSGLWYVAVTGDGDAVMTEVFP
jgi:hypothetical protein